MYLLRWRTSTSRSQAAKDRTSCTGGSYCPSWTRQNRTSMASRRQPRRPSHNPMQPRSRQTARARLLSARRSLGRRAAGASLMYFMCQHDTADTGWYRIFLSVQNACITGSSWMSSWSRQCVKLSLLDAGDLSAGWQLLLCQAHALPRTGMFLAASRSFMLLLSCLRSGTLCVIMTLHASGGREAFLPVEHITPYAEASTIGVRKTARTLIMLRNLGFC